MIELEFLTSNSDDIELCRRYWELKGDGTFKESRQSMYSSFPAADIRGLDFALFLSAVARDTRRRCPSCGMAQRVESREQALVLTALTTPCSECVSLKNDLLIERPVATASSNDGISVSGFRFPVAALATLHALSATVQRRELNNGFSVQDCVGFAPAHLKRFLTKLSDARVIERVASPANSLNMGSAITYRLTNDPGFKQDFANFKHLLEAGARLDHRSLWVLWLDYAVSECVAFVCSESILLGLPTDPEDERLCLALRTAVATYSIGEVWSMSQLAVREAAGLVEHGYTISEATSTIPLNIVRVFQAASSQSPAPEPIGRSYLDPRPHFSEWFYRWYGAYVHTRGPVVADLLRG